MQKVNELLDRDLAGNAEESRRLLRIQTGKLPHVKEVRHQGLLVGVEFDDTIGGVDVKHGCLDRKASDHCDRSTYHPYDPTAYRDRRRCERKQLLSLKIRSNLWKNK
ncbi:MAG: hypothetical protein ACLR2O_04800 [Coprococcus sp.]